MDGGKFKRMEQEIWKDIEGYEGYYQISNFGRVRSLDRTVLMRYNLPQRRKSQIIKPAKSGCGYLTYCLGKDRVRKTQKAHRLVAKAFLSNPNNLPDVNHKDFNRHNNRLENLEWCTPSQNRIHSRDAGRLNSPKGEKTYNAKLTEAIVRHIRQKEFPTNQYAKIYNISTQYVWEIQRGQIWKHVV